MAHDYTLDGDTAFLHAGAEVDQDMQRRAALVLADLVVRTYCRRPYSWGLHSHRNRLSTKLTEMLLMTGILDEPPAEYLYRQARVANFKGATRVREH